MDNFNKYKNLFIERLFDLMETKNISELGRQTGIPERTINGWLRGVATPRMEYIVKLSLFFDVSSDYLLGIEDEFGNKNYLN